MLRLGSPKHPCLYLYLYLQVLRVVVLNMRVIDTYCLEPGRFGEDHWKLKKECATLRKECSELPNEPLGQIKDKLEVLIVLIIYLPISRSIRLACSQRFGSSLS